MTFTRPTQCLPQRATFLWPVSSRGSWQVRTGSSSRQRAPRMAVYPQFRTLAVFSRRIYHQTGLVLSRTLSIRSSGSHPTTRGAHRILSSLRTGSLTYRAMDLRCIQQAHRLHTPHPSTMGSTVLHRNSQSTRRARSLRAPRPSPLILLNHRTRRQLTLVPRTSIIINHGIILHRPRGRRWTTQWLRRTSRNTSTVIFSPCCPPHLQALSKCIPHPTFIYLPLN